MLFVPSDSCSASVITCQHGMHAQLQALINVQMYFSVQHSTRSIQNHIEHGLMIFGVAGFQHLLLPGQHWIYFGNYGIHPINFISMIQSAYMLISYSGNIMEIFWKLFLNIGLASLWPMFTIFGKCLAQFFRSQLISVSEFCVFVMLCSRQC